MSVSRMHNLHTYIKYVNPLFMLLMEPFPSENFIPTKKSWNPHTPDKRRHILAAASFIHPEDKQNETRMSPYNTLPSKPRVCMGSKCTACHRRTTRKCLDEDKQRRVQQQRGKSVRQLLVGQDSHTGDLSLTKQSEEGEPKQMKPHLPSWGWENVWETTD